MNGVGGMGGGNGGMTINLNGNGGGGGFKMYSGGTEINMSPSNNGNGFNFGSNGNGGRFNQGNGGNGNQNRFNGGGRTPLSNAAGRAGRVMACPIITARMAATAVSASLRRTSTQPNDLDINHDEKLSADEIPENSDLQGSSFKEYDKNQDGFIDYSEYKAYMADKFGTTAEDGSFGGNYKEKKLDLPVAVRYGKLPAGLPNWWVPLDTDKDGQVGLYEWRTDGREVKDFQDYDLDADGILAPQEWQQYNFRNAQKAKDIAAQVGLEGAGDTPHANARHRNPGDAGPGRTRPGRTRRWHGTAWRRRPQCRWTGTGRTGRRQSPGRRQPR